MANLKLFFTLTAKKEEKKKPTEPSPTLQRMKTGLRGQKLTSFLSLERGALLLLLAVSLAGTTVICCTGMLLFPGNAPVLLPQHSQHAAPSRPLNRVPTCDPLSHPREKGTALNPDHQEEPRWNGIRSPWQQ